MLETGFNLFLTFAGMFPEIIAISFMFGLVGFVIGCIRNILAKHKQSK